MYDRAMQVLYSMALEPISEATADRNHKVIFEYHLKSYSLTKEKYYILKKYQYQQGIFQHINNGFDFLSRFYCRFNGHVYCIPSEKAVSNFERDLEDFNIS